MKAFSFLLVIFLISGSSFGQSSEKFAQNMDKLYEAGNSTFLEEVYESIKYPQEARENCRVGVLKTLISTDTAGAIESIILGNRLGMGIEAEVIRVLNLTSGKWRKGKKLKYPINFAFRIGKNQKDFAGDINITAFAVGYQAHSGCSIPQKGLEKQVRKYRKKGKLEKAKLVYEELLRRYPDSKEYRQGLTEIVKEN